MLSRYFEAKMLPGFKCDSEGRLMFDLTAEEQREVEYVFKVATDEGVIVQNEYAQRIEQSMMAFALVGYAKDQVCLAEICDTTEKKDLLHKALAAIAKAGSLHELPIYQFDLACVFEFLGEKEIAAECFREFLSRCEKFKPINVDVSAAKQRDVRLAMTIAGKEAQCNSLTELERRKASSHAKEWRRNSGGVRRAEVATSIPLSVICLTSSI